MIRRCRFALVACVGVLLPSAGAAEFYVAPVRGDTNNDGTAQRPWRSIQAVFDQGLVESRQWARLPYGDNAELMPRNEGVPIQAGDTIDLRSGYHGTLHIRQRKWQGRPG